MVKDLERTYGLILGGSSGLGYASAKKCAAHGMRLIIIYRAPRMHQEEVDERFSQLENAKEHLFINYDATNAQKIPALIEQISQFLNGKQLHLLLHSISKGNLKPMLGDNALTSADLMQTIDSMGINLYAWTKSLIDHNLMKNPSRVLSLTSEGNQKPMPGYAAVSAAKVTIEALTRNMAIEYASLGITSNCVQAGVTDTQSLQRIPNYDQLKAESLNRNPLGRLTQSEDVGDVIYLLCRSEAQFINGTIIKVDGGESLN